MIVATRTPQRKPQKCLAKCVDPIVDAIGFVLCDVDRRMHLFTQQPEAGADNRFVGPRLGIQAGMLEPVASNLFPHKLIVGQAVVERLDDPITVTPGVGDRVIRLVTSRFTVADNIEPVSGKTLSVVWGR